MQLSEYQKLTSRTNTDLGSKAINAAHVTLGIVGEWEEFDYEYYEGSNGNNLIKESGDCTWYISELANIFNLKLEIEFDAEHSFESYQAMVAEAIKKYLAYGKEIDLVWLNSALNYLLGYIRYRIEDAGYTMEEVFETNIKKLQLRYPEKFSAELAMAKGDENINP